MGPPATGVLLAIRHPDGSYRMGPGGREPGEADALAGEAIRLRDAAPDEVRRGWASVCLGWITDNVLADRDAAPAHYEVGLAAARATGDPVLLFEAQRHLGDHAHDDGDPVGARERWEESTAAGGRARHIGGTLRSSCCRCCTGTRVTRRCSGDRREVLRWASAIGAAVPPPGGGVPGRRRPTGAGEDSAGWRARKFIATKPTTGSRSWLKPSTLVCTRPRSGLLAETRAAATVTRIRSRHLAAAVAASSSTPGEASEVT